MHGNFKDLPRLVFMSEEYRNLKVELDGKELTRNINKKKNPVALQNLRCLLYDKCCRRDSYFNKYVENPVRNTYDLFTVFMQKLKVN